MSVLPEDKIILQFYEDLRRQENLYGVKICVPKENIIDGKHLDCFWYGGEIGYIEYKGYKIVIGAYGDRRVNGRINGRPFFYKSKDNRYAFHDGDTDLITDDNHLHQLLDSDDPNNHLYFSDNNWFEVDLIAPSGEWIDLCGCDNVLDNNLLDCFSGVNTYFEYVEWAIDGEK